MEMLQITELRKRFGDKEVLKGLNLTVPEHSIFGFIGKNGRQNNDNENHPGTAESRLRRNPGKR